MSTDRLRQMTLLSQALYHREYQRIRHVLAEEAAVCGRLARLDDQRAAVCAHDAAGDGYRTSGADILWFGWESRNRRALNTDLARTRALKLAAMDDLRLAFGRKQAIEHLEEQSLDRKRTAQRNKRDTALLASILTDKPR